MASMKSMHIQCNPRKLSSFRRPADFVRTPLPYEPRSLGYPRSRKNGGHEPESTSRSGCRTGLSAPHLAFAAEQLADGGTWRRPGDAVGRDYASYGRWPCAGYYIQVIYDHR